MFIVCLHPEHESPWVDEVPVMEAEVEAVMAARRSVLDVTDTKGDVCGGCFAVADSKTLLWSGSRETVFGKDSTVVEFACASVKTLYKVTNDSVTLNDTTYESCRYLA